MELLENAYVLFIPVMIFIALMIINRKDKCEDALLKKRITDSIKEKSPTGAFTVFEESE